MALIEEFFNKYASRFPGKVTRLPVFREEESWVADSSILHDLLSQLKKEEEFIYLVDISSVDNFGKEPRFEVVYELCRLEDLAHIRIKTTVSEDHLSVPTISDIWKGANWLEREVFDMMGIRFDGHPDLRRILMWDGYPFHPLRKDFPLAGKPTEMPDIAFTKPAPLEGGPFITSPADLSADKEPHARPAEVVEGNS